MTIKTWGLMGGGQLACFLLEAAQKESVDLRLLLASREEPGALFTSNYIVAKQDSSLFEKFLGEISTLIFENEFVDVDALSQKIRPEILCVPRLDVLSQVRNKLSQKQILQHLKLKSAPFEVLTKENSLSFMKRCQGIFPEGFVLKWSLYGYDGKGNFFWKPGDQNTEEKMKDFIEQGLARGAQIYAEKRIDFHRELALVSCQSLEGEFVFYPLVISEQSSGICRRVLGPASSLGVDSEKQIEAQNAARRLGQSLPLQGTFAIEFFEDSQGALWVNEIAPRVHNSGHYSLDACAVSQFRNHIRAVAGKNLLPPESTPYFAMLNLLGPSGLNFSRKTTESPRLASLAPNTKFHWYKKRDIKPGRKLGHLNLWAQDRKEFDLGLEKLSLLESEWITVMNEEAQNA